MSNAAKHRKKAAEFEQLKQIDRAIASYVKAIEESEEAGEDVDVALYNKVGDLALRQGRVPDAITYYERAVEHYATSGLFNNAIALCNKILRNAPGRANVYFTLGRISARKGLRGDASRNFLEYATRMQQEGRIEEGIRALAEVLDLMPELNDVRAMVDELASRAGIALPRRKTPLRTDRVPTPVSSPAVRDQKSQDLIFLDIDYGEPRPRTPVQSPRIPTPSIPFLPAVGTPPAVIAVDGFEQTVAPSAAEAGTVPLEGLEANDEFGEDVVTPTLAGFAPEELLAPDDVSDPSASHADVTWLVPPEESAPLPELVSEDFRDAANDPGVVRAIYTETPPFVPTIVSDAVIDAVVDVESIELEPLLVEPVPELDEAIAAGDALVQRAEDEAARASAVPSAPPETMVPGPRTPTSSSRIVGLDHIEEQLAPVRPPFRLDPHDFILPGELPPLLLDDTIVEAGLRAAAAAWPTGPTGAAAPGDAGKNGPVVSTMEAEAPALEAGTPLVAVPAPLEYSAGEGAPTASDPVPDVAADFAPDLTAEVPLGAESGATSGVTPARPSVTVTPSLPIAAVAEAAVTVASSRRDSLRAAVARMPKNWLLRRRLAEALFEAGERDAALHELETAQQGLVTDGELAAASDIADELVHVSPDRVAYHQKRVELAVRSADQQRLRFAYLDLADALVRLGEEGRARAVYARVLEIDPHDDRARAALGAAAPPPPPPAPATDERFVDLAEWLRDDDKPADTRMRMREPAISGDEQADFDALLRHFKEGVSRSLGEDDFESHYDLGVAFKEMGLLDDAIAEFQKALRSRTHRLPAYEALGQCFVEQGRFQVAATVLSRALHEPGLDDDQRVGVLYLLAFSCEALQRRDEARSYFQRVYATDINFRDVAARLAALEQASR